MPLFGFGKKDEPQTRFFEHFGDKTYSMSDKTAAPAVDNVAPDASPSTPATPKKTKKPKGTTPAASPDTGLFRRASRKSFSKTADGPQAITVESLSGAYTEHTPARTKEDKGGKDSNLQRFASGSSDNADGSYRRSSVIRAFSSGNDKAEEPKDAGVQRKDSRRRSFAPLGNNVGDFEFDQLRRKTSRDEPLSRTKSNAEPRVITFDDMAAEPKLERKTTNSQTTAAAPADGKRRQSFAPLGAMAGDMEFNNLQRRSSRDDAQRRGSRDESLSRTKSAEPRTLGFDDLSAEPDIKRQQSIKFAQTSDAPRRKSFAPLGNSVGDIDFNQLSRRRSSVEEPDLTRAKSNVEPETARPELMPKETPAQPLQRKSSIKFAGEERRRSFALFGNNAGGFEFDQLSRSKSREAPDERRLSLARSTSRGEPVTLGFDDLANHPHAEPTAAPVSRSNSTRRRSFAPLGSAAGEIDLGLTQSRSRTDTTGDRRLSLSRSRSREPKTEIGFDDLVNHPFTKATATTSDKERRRSIALLGSSVQPLDFGQLERQTSRGGGLGRRLSLGRSNSRKDKRDEKDVPPPLIISAPKVPTADDASDREAYATPLEGDEERPEMFAATAADVPEEAIQDDDDGDDNEGERARDLEDNLSVPTATDRTPSPSNGHSHNGVLNGILLRPVSQMEELAPPVDVDETVPDHSSAIEAQEVHRPADPAPWLNGSEKSVEVTDKGYLTYQTPHAREWRRRWYRIVGQELELYIAKEDLAPTQKIKLGPGSTVDQEYEGSQAEGSFRIRAVDHDGADDYFVFCDSSAFKQKLINGVQAALSG